MSHPGSFFISDSEIFLDTDEGGVSLSGINDRRLKKVAGKRSDQI